MDITSIPCVTVSILENLVTVVTAMNKEMKRRKKKNLNPYTQSTIHQNEFQVHHLNYAYLNILNPETMDMSLILSFRHYTHIPRYKIK